jgi:hypothetical protein
MSTISVLQRGLDGGGVEQLVFLDLAAQAVEQVLGGVHAGVRHQQRRFQFLVQVFVDARADEQQRQVVRGLGQAGLQARHPGFLFLGFAARALGGFGRAGLRSRSTGWRRPARSFRDRIDAPGVARGRLFRRLRRRRRLGGGQAGTKVSSPAPNRRRRKPGWAGASAGASGAGAAAADSAWTGVSASGFFFLKKLNMDVVGEGNCMHMPDFAGHVNDRGILPERHGAPVGWLPGKLAANSAVRQLIHIVARMLLISCISIRRLENRPRLV